MYGFTARWRCEAAFPTQALLLLLPLLHLSVLFITPLYILPLPVYISVLLCLPISLLPLPSPHRLHSSRLSSTVWAPPGFHLRRSAAASGSLKPAGSSLWPSWRTICRNTEIKATFNTCWFYCLKIQHVLFQSTKHMDSSSTSCDHYTRDASVY